MTGELHLIRHGATRANELRLYCGATDLPLSEAGRAEVAALAARGVYPDIGAARAYTSGMLRARETFQLIWGERAHGALRALREFDFGRFEMRSYEELRADAAYIAWIGDEGGRTRCPGGESNEIFRARVLKCLDALLLGEGGDVAVVTHGGVVAAAMARLFPQENKHFYEWQPGPARGYSVRVLAGRAVRYDAIGKAGV